jgi:NAD(P)H-nitrite reductase large subunit
MCGAGTGCGGCKPLVEKLVEREAPAPATAAQRPSMVPAA